MKYVQWAKYQIFTIIKYNKQLIEKIIKYIYSRAKFRWNYHCLCCLVYSMLSSTCPSSITFNMKCFYNPTKEINKYIKFSNNKLYTILSYKLKIILS